MDDGPLYGEVPQRFFKSTPRGTMVFDFGLIEISHSNNRIILTARDHRSRIIWHRVMKGANPERYLKNLKFERAENTSLAIIVHFFSEGERLNLFIKPNGRFMYYYHSW